MRSRQVCARCYEEMKRPLTKGTTREMLVASCAFLTKGSMETRSAARRLPVPEYCPYVVEHAVEMGDGWSLAQYLAEGECQEGGVPMDRALDKKLRK